MKAWLCALVLFVVCGPVGWACIWIDGTTLEGKLARVEGRMGFVEGVHPVSTVWLSSAELKRARTQAGELRALAAMPPENVLKMQTVSQRNLPEDWPPGLNEAVQPIFTGDFKKAAEMLAELEKKYPENYYVCANLAVTSELTGRDAEALAWVEKAMRINPEAHYGTEWMHAAVLRAKLAMAKDPAWLETHTISGIPLGEVPEGFTLTEGERQIELEDIQSALVAHLVPRILLVKGQDRIVAALLSELARVEARASSVEEGIDMLKLAAEHGAANMGPRLKEWEQIVARREKRERVENWAWRAVSAVLVVAVAAWAVWAVWAYRRWASKLAQSSGGGVEGDLP